MSRFNLLLITTDAALRPQVLKTLSRVFSSNFVFEVARLADGEDLLRKLRIDMLVVDVDIERLDFIGLDRRFPDMMMVGISKNPRNIDIPMNVYKHRLFSKAEMQSDLLAELKAIRKNPNMIDEKGRKQKVAQPAESVDFRDFSPLLTSK